MNCGDDPERKGSDECGGGNCENPGPDDAARDAPFHRRQATSCADADDAIFTGHFLDQILNDESRLRPLEVNRAQPAIEWRNPPLVDATVTP